jgi:multiple sugar transport system ATP-binding protein
MAEIRIEGVEKRFNDVTVVTGMDLIIRDGEFFTFVGPSGCGKSTVLNMIAGLEPVTAGRIYFNGTVVNDLSPQERDVAMVFQSYALYPHMTVYENISFPLVMKKRDKDFIDGEVKRVASLLGLHDLLARKPKELSGGQRQRVALGRAIIRKPKVFLMDEPLSNLDARLRVEMRAELKRLHRELAITTVYVTHDQAEALSLSDRIAILHRAEIQQCGTPEEVYLKPVNIFVGGFMGSPPLNIAACRLRHSHPLEIDCNGMAFLPKTETAPERPDLLMGVRPEDVRISTERLDHGIEVTVSVVENAGSFNWVDVMWEDSMVKGVSGLDDTPKTGGKAFMEFPIGKVLIFDAESGKRL